jgi:protein-tyrosine phosphatase
MTGHNAEKATARPDEDRGGQMTEAILVLCTANRCRSPIAAAFLSRHLAARGAATAVRSAGMTGGGDPALPEAVSVMAGYGIDIASHRSRMVSAADLAASALVLGMTREHVRHAVATVPGTWPRAFTLKELVRLGERTGPRLPGEPFSAWLSGPHKGRDRAALLGDAPEDDVTDPVGGPLSSHAEMAAIVRDLTGRLCELCWARVRPAS